MPLVPSAVPAKIVAGDFVTFNLSFSDFPAGTYTLVWIVPGIGTFTASADGTNHLFEIGQSGSSDGWTAGTYQWTLRATHASNGQVYTAQRGVVEILPDPAGQTSQTGELADAETALTNINALLANRASSDQKRYRINDRELERYSVDELLRLRAYFVSRVSTLKAELGVSGASKRLRARFVRAR